MGTIITVAMILAMIALGVLVIHLLNRRRNQRIAAFRYSRYLPEPRDRANRAERRDHRDQGRGRLLPRRRVHGRARGRGRA